MKDEQKRVVMLESLATDKMVGVVFSPSAAGVVVPDHLKAEDTVMLDFGRRAPTPVTDIECTTEEMKSDPIIWEPRAIPVNGCSSPMPDKLRAGEHDSDKPCPDPACPAGSTLSLEVVHGRVRMGCACGITGAWASDDEEANNNWDRLPREA